MHLELAPDAAVRTDRVRHALGRLVPRAYLAHVVFALEHQRTRRAYADAVAAVHAGARIERHGVLGGDPRVEATSGHRDRERVLRVGAARLHALVAQHATPVVANVQLVVDLHRLLDRLGHGRVRIVMVPGLAGVALPRRQRLHRRAEPLGISRVLVLPAVPVIARERRVDARAEELHHQLAGLPHALGVGRDLHPRLGRARARRDQHARPFDLTDTYPAGVDRGPF